jgi:hypothetical protein
MGVILKYQLDFPEVGLKVSNDIFSGEFNIDANITAEMKRNTGGASFNIELIDLPLTKADEIRIQATAPLLATVIIKLGYFDSPFEEVMRGVIQKIKSTVQGEKLITTIVGQETGTYALENNTVEITLEDDIKITDAVNQILSSSQISRGEITQTGTFQRIPDDRRLRHGAIRRTKAMKILDKFSEIANSEFFVSDKKVWMGKPIRDDESYRPPPTFDRESNLAIFSPIDNDVTEEGGPDVLTRLPATRADGFRFTVIGDPKLRPGQRVKAAVDAYGSEAVDFRIHSVAHKFNMTSGYVCQGSAMRVVDDDNCRRRERSLGIPGAAAVANSVNQLSENGQRTHPTLEVGKVKSYAPGESTGTERHLSTLYFGQPAERTETQPSINIEIESNEQRLFRNKPVVSPFAWHKCGLMVPVYEGMKSVLGHNLNLPDDVLVSGFIWSDSPNIEPPKNKAGDWWLCLPIDFDTANPPSDSTKAANDLTANNGKRVIEVKGLKVTIGAGALGNVGDRPQEGNDDECLIEHSSGAKVLIKNSEIQLTDGSVTLKIASGAVTIS